MMVYQWKSGTHWKADPQIAGQRLTNLIEENDGLLVAARVVEDAQPAESPLHDDFEWDDSIAANEWREYTARHMIKSLVIVAEPEKEQESIIPVRAFVNVRQESGRGFTTTARAVSDEELFRQIIDDALKAIGNYRMKLAAFRQYGRVERAFADLVETLKAVKD